MKNASKRNFWFLLFITFAVNVQAQTIFLNAEYANGPDKITALDDKLIFFTGGNETVRMWECRGTTESIREIMKFDFYSIVSIVKRYSKLIFFSTGFYSGYPGGDGDLTSTLWASDGTKEGTVSLVSGSAPYYGSNGHSGVRIPGPGSCNFYVTEEGGLFYIQKIETGMDGAFSSSELWSFSESEGTAKRVLHNDKDPDFTNSAAADTPYNRDPDLLKELADKHKGKAVIDFAVFEGTVYYLVRYLTRSESVGETSDRIIITNTYTTELRKKTGDTFTEQPVMTWSSSEYNSWSPRDPLKIIEAENDYNSIP